MRVVQVPVSRDVFESLKKLAEPLVDDASSVIARLIKHWKSTAPQPGKRPIAIPGTLPKTEWRSARGEQFPIGTELRANYLNHQFRAKVTASGIEFNGKTYDNPSSAGIAAKMSVGKSGSAANTNGWKFWEIEDAVTKRWRSINVLRAKRGA